MYHTFLGRSNVCAEWAPAGVHASVSAKPQHRKQEVYGIDLGRCCDIAQILKLVVACTRLIARAGAGVRSGDKRVQHSTGVWYHPPLATLKSSCVFHYVPSTLEHPSWRLPTISAQTHRKGSGLAVVPVMATVQRPSLVFILSLLQHTSYMSFSLTS